MALITKIKTVYSEVIAALGFTPENSANKGQPNGYAGLDAGGRVPSAQLPSYVDDVQEYANLAAFPNPGQAGIIYLALDTNIIYRWSGSTYIEIASGDVAWNNITGKPTFGTMSSQDANSVNITGGTANVTSSVIGNLSLATNQITSTQAGDDILITPTGIGSLKVQNRITLEDRLSFGPTDPQGSYFANNAEYLQAGPLSAWSYLQNGTATKVEFDNGAAMSISNAASGNAGDLILGWTEVLNISSAGDVVTGNWTAGIIDSNYGGTGVDNNGNTLTITANATISGTNTGDQTDITGNAGTATALQTARTINGVAFDGTANITIATATPNNLTIASPLTGGSFNGSAPVTIGLPTANSTVTGALSSTDWATFNTKQAALSGAGIVKSTNGTISYLTDNSSNWDTAYARSLTSATVTGTTTKTLTLNQQGGTNITASWSDLNTDAVTSVFGRTGAVVATEGDYSLTQLSDVNLASPANGQLLRNNGTQWVNWTPNYLTANQVVTLSGDVTGTGATTITTELQNSGVVANTYGSASSVPVLIVNSKGLITNASNVTINDTNKLPLAGGTLTGQLITTLANNVATGQGQIYLNGATGNRIDFNINGVADPAFTTRSVGTKIVLYPAISGSAVDFALGVSTYTLWYSAPTTTSQHRFFTGTTSVARIRNDGIQTRATLYEGNAAFTVLDTTATLTIAQILTLVIESTPTANITFTLPTGTNTDAGVMSSLETFASFTWSIVNIATGFTITMAGNTGNTYIGNTTIAANTSATFRTQKTAANTFKTVRI